MAIPGDSRLRSLLLPVAGIEGLPRTSRAPGAAGEIAINSPLLTCGGGPATASRASPTKMPPLRRADFYCYVAGLGIVSCLAARSTNQPTGMTTSP
jgi:hypothetical protein